MLQQANLQQAMIEREALKHIIGALRTVMDWKPEGDDSSRKLSSLRFIAGSFQRHLERIMALKEQNGYMASALERSPNLAPKVQALLEEHDRFEETMHRLVLQLDNLSPTDASGIDAICRELGELFTKLDEHDRREAKLTQEAFQRDVGGQG
jgi:Hemerythrin HHE cation binding domain